MMHFSRKGSLFCTVLLLSLSFQISKCGNVLFIMMPAYSFVPPLVSIADSLLKHGHQSTFILSDSLAQVPILMDKNIKIIVSDGMSKFKLKEKIDNQAQAAFRGETLLKFKLRRYFSELCELVLEDKKLFDELVKYKFDVAVVSKHPIAICFNIVAYKLSLPFIHCGIGYDAVNDRLPYLPSFVTDIYFMGYSDRMRFGQKIINTLFFLYRQSYPDLITRPAAVAKYAPERPFISTKDLWLQTKFHLIDSDILFDYARPIFPNYAFVAGLSVNGVQKLPREFLNFIEKTKNDIIIMSFGTLIDTFPENILEKFIETFRILYHHSFIIKLDEKQQINMSNVLQRSWIPQNDLLAHPKTNVFITHCGHNGQVEAVYHGVPMIGFPVILDQHYNARRILSKGFGLIMDINSFTTNDLVSNIEKILGDPQFKNAIGKASTIFKNRKEKPRDIAAYWIDHIIKYDGDYMHPKSVDIPFFEYYLLDIILVWFVIEFALIALLYLCIRKLLSNKQSKIKTA